MKLDPLNISILDPNEYIVRKNALPVTSHAIYETSTKQFHPDGFFSEVIFGQIGSSDRLIRRGYLELRTNIISPYLFKQMMTLKSFYQEVLAGKTYAYLDPETQDLVKTTPDDENGDSGYSFFLSILPKLKFAITDSIKRKDKIALIEKYKDKLITNRFIVLPAGVRDIRETSGRVTPEEINKLYNNLLTLTEALPEKGSDDRIYDAIRYQIQMKVQEIYGYISNLIDGKGGFAQGKYSHRNVALSNRNVITAAIISRTKDSKAPNKFSIDEVEIPLFQAMKGAVPLVTYKLKTGFFDTIFNTQTSTIPLINPSTNVLEYCDISNAELNRFTTSDGIESLINDFRNVEIQMDPATVRVKNEKGKTVGYYLYLVYDTGEDIYICRNHEDIATFMKEVKQPDTTILHRTDLPLNLSEGCTVVGSSVIDVYQRKQETTHDLDIVVSEAIWEQIRNSKDWVKRGIAYHHTGANIDAYYDGFVSSEGYDKWKKDNSIEVDGYSIMTLDALYAHYLANPRLKDKSNYRYLKNRVLDKKNFRPMTWAELFYMATYAALVNKYGTATRQPILRIESIQAYKLHLMSTAPSRIVTLRFTSNFNAGITVPEYPSMTEIVKGSMSVHPATLGRYDGDHDGDVLGLNILLTDEANNAVKDYLDSPISMVDANGSLVYGLGDGRLCKFSLCATSFYDLDRDQSFRDVDN